MARQRRSYPQRPASDFKKLDSKSYVDKDTGEKISRRQFLNQTRGRSVESYKAVREEAHRWGPPAPPPPRSGKVPSNPSSKLKRYAKGRGATMEAYRTGSDSIPPTLKQTAAGVNKAIDAQRAETVRLKEKTGVITSKQAEQLRTENRAERYWRNSMQAINDKLAQNAHTPGGRPLTNRQREILNADYIKAHRKYEQARRALMRQGIIPEEGSDYNAGYYH